MQTMNLTRLALHTATILGVTWMLNARPRAAEAICVNPSCSTVTVGAVSYDVSTVTGSYESLGGSTNSLDQQPWWGSSELATIFATAVGDSLGLPNPDVGPYFAYLPAFANVYLGNNYTPPENGVVVRMAYADLFLGNLCCSGDLVPSARRASYAVVTSSVTAVPTPALLPGLVGMSLSLWRKKQKEEVVA